jgi:hypothetical protein
MSFLLVIMFVTPCLSQLEAPTKPKSAKEFKERSGHALGAVLSSVNGKGLAYRYWKNRLGFHTSFIPLTRDGAKYYNAGISGYYSIRNYDIGSLFIHAGFEFQQMIDEETPFFSAPPDFRETTTGYNFGFGPGLHVLQKFISMDLFIGYGFYARERKSNIIGDQTDNTFSSTLSGGIAFFIEL